MAVVSQTPNTKIIQGQIADSLNFKFEEETEQGRAGRLYLRLKKEKRILIILDDVWAELDLTTVGIPFGDDQKGCKIFLTTRRLQVCHAMRCQHQFQLDALNEKEGLSLLKSHAGISDESPTLNDMAIKVAGECKGLPLAIVSVGSALRQKTISEWKEALRKLKMSKLNVIENVDRDVYACLQFSYDYLKSQEIKSYFLLCSLFPEDHEIDLEELVRYGMGLGLNLDADSIEDSRDQLCAMVDNLKASCLLLDAGEKDFIKMHDVVRDFALWMASKQNHAFLVNAGISELQKVESQEQYMAINLVEWERGIMLPDGLMYPNLQILILDAYRYGLTLSKASDAFFEGMKALKVLTLTQVQLSMKSLQFLTNLRTLHLKYCELEGISSLGMLKRLEILSLEGSVFDELPEELGELSQLRLLDLFNCFTLKRIPPNVLQRLSHLEELYIGSSSYSSWAGERMDAETSNVSLSELNSLRRLTHLLLHIHDECLPKDFAFSSTLQSYEIKVNEFSEYPLWLGRTTIAKRKFSKSRILNIRSGKFTTFAAFKALYPTLEHFNSSYSEFSENIVPTIDPKGLNELKSLQLEYCEELKCIVDASLQQVPATAFSNLVELSLDYLPGLREICHDGRPPKEFLEKLESISVTGCKDMYTLFPTMLVQRLHKLKKADINYCYKLQEVFELEGLCHSGEENLVLLSNLEELKLNKLPELRCIWKGPTQYLRLKSLKKFEVIYCHSLTYLFSSSLAQSLVQLEEVIVDGCKRLEHFVSSSEEDNKGEENVVAANGNDILLPKLRKLRLQYLPNLISLCPKNYKTTWPTTLEELALWGFRNFAPSFIVELEAVMKTAIEKLRILELINSNLQLCNTVLGLLRFGLPNLKMLRLKYLAELESLFKGPIHVLGLQNLTNLEIQWCNSLKHIFSLTLAQNLVQLKHLKIGNCEELEQILVVDDETLLNNKDHLFFPNLFQIKVIECHKLKCVFPINIGRHLQQLQKINVIGVNQLEEVFGHTDSGDLTNDKEIMLPQLQELSLFSLPNLTNFCSVSYHFIFPSLESLLVRSCPKITTRFSYAQNNQSVHAEAKASKTSKEDGSAEFPTEINVARRSGSKLSNILPPYKEQ
ncbi:disease resistance protein At4g27190-like [Pistacia vera]|uniref:disease resistance protein At4g27190-like n=1 Tax=Pistacia vera TaxID=55513 RepID=UPI001263C620|nr:disease resistance protein At4g27190-like [Pistacia vera]